ncbi:MAG: hypothetical protein QF830_05055 [Rhodospirillales bacterium]|nr:hypothetical protein [Rhodospirillales bacterium]
MSTTRTSRVFAAARGIGLAALVVVGATAPAWAAEQRYSTWPDPSRTGPGDGRLQEMIDALGALVDEAERARAADPRLLRDLRDLARRFERPWRTLIFSDDFSDGDFTANPAWTVTAGRYWVQQGYGLRSAITPAAPAPSPSTGGAGQKEGLATAIIGSILNQALSQKGRQSSQQPAAVPDRAAIHVAGEITNAFSIRLEITSWEGKGHLQFGPYQGAAADGGYRLAYRPGASPGLELLRVSGRGVGIVGSITGPLVLEDQRTHVIEWTRDAFGAMTVTIDGKEQIRATDRGFREPFDGFAMVNRGGDYILGRIAIHGTK